MLRNTLLRTQATAPSCCHLREPLVLGPVLDVDYLVATLVDKGDDIVDVAELLHEAPLLHDARSVQGRSRDAALLKEG